MPIHEYRCDESGRVLKVLQRAVKPTAQRLDPQGITLGGGVTLGMLGS